jgi:hypothetical protein
MTPRSMSVVRAGASTALLGLAVRRVGRRSGATAAEAHAPLPGDEVVPEPLWESTRAITIDAPPAEVWPWIVQMGFPAYRAGWYTPYWLDRMQWGIRERSADEILPELQHLAVGDRVPDSRDWSAFFTVVTVAPDRALSALHAPHPRAHAVERVHLGVRVEGAQRRIDASADPSARPHGALGRTAPPPAAHLARRLRQRLGDAARDQGAGRAEA